MNALRRRGPASAVLVAAAASFGACGIIGGDSKSTPTTLPPTTTTTKLIVVAVAPEAGEINTTFTFVGVGFTPGDDVTFVVEFPNGNRFAGQPHVVAQNTTVSASYKATPGNPVGDYVVRATSTRGESAQGKFTVLGPGGAQAPTGQAGQTGTTARGGTTLIPQGGTTTSTTSSGTRSTTTTSR